MDVWDPRKDPQPIHLWLHPWLPQLGDRMQPLYVGIRHKLASVLEQWHPSDPSANAVLLPWRDVFRDVDMETLLARSILPKLVVALRDFHINPANQQMGVSRARGRARSGHALTFDGLGRACSVIPPAAPAIKTNGHHRAVPMGHGMEQSAAARGHGGPVGQRVLPAVARGPASVARQLAKL